MRQLDGKPTYPDDTVGRRCCVRSEVVGKSYGDDVSLPCVRPHRPRHSAHYGITVHPVTHERTWWEWQ